MRCLRICALVLAVISSSAVLCLPQVVPDRESKNIELTGVVLVSDHRCANKPSTDRSCRISDFALVSGNTVYLLYGDQSTLQKFGRQRVRVGGVLEQEPVMSYGMHLIRRKIAVRSIDNNELPEREIERFVQQLSVVPWRGPENHCRPMCWDFALTDPMVNILQAGRGAQDVLLRHINDERIKDQIVMLLGGVGDENAIAPIIGTMADADQASFDTSAKRLNLIADLALTNLTVSEVIWHHGGGIPLDRCPDDPKSCWSNWWNEHEGSFKVGIGGNRLYTNYPNYGIYAQFEDASPR